MSFFNSDGFGNQLASFGLNALGGTAASLIGGALNQKYAKDSFKRQNDYNNWLIQNGPSMQVNALRSAGLNPALMNGNIPQLAGGSAPSGSTSPFFNGTDYNPSLATIDSTNNLNQKLADKAEVEAIRASDLLPYEKRELESRALKQELEADQLDVMTPIQAENVIKQSHWLETQERIALAKLPGELEVIAADYILRISSANKNDAERVKAYQEVQNLKKSLALLGAQTKYYSSLSEVNRATARKINEELKFIQPTIDKLKAEGRSISADALYKEFTNRVNAKVGEEQMSEMIKAGFNMDMYKSYIDMAIKYTSQSDKLNYTGPSGVQMDEFLKHQTNFYGKYLYKLAE